MTDTTTTVDTSAVAKSSSTVVVALNGQLLRRVELLTI